MSHLAPHPPTRSLAQVAMCVCMDTHTLGARAAGSAASWRGPAPWEGAGAKAIQAYRWWLPLGLRGRAEQPAVWGECSGTGWQSLLRRTPHNGCPAHPPGIRSVFSPLRPCGRGRNVTEAATSQAQAPPASPAPPTAPNQRAHWRRRGSSHQPAPRLPDRASVSMGVTGGSGLARGGAGRRGAGGAGKVKVRGGAGNRPGAPPPAPKARGGWKVGRPGRSVDRSRPSPGPQTSAPSLGHAQGTSVCAQARMHTSE